MRDHPITRAVIGDEVRRARGLAGLSREDAAAAWGVAPGTLARLERGDTVRPSSLRAVLDAGIRDEGFASAIRAGLEREQLLDRFELVAGLDQESWTAVVPLLQRLRPARAS